MLLSIIIPVYNVEAYLRECLDSVYSQDLSDCEVILVDDGSTDASPLILKEYESSFSQKTVLVSKENGGLSSARNAGLSSASGDFVFFLDGDDYISKDAVSTIQSVIKQYPADILYLDCIATDKGNRLASFPFQYRTNLEAMSLYGQFQQSRIPILPNSVSYLFSLPFLKSNGLAFTEGLTHEDVLFKYQVFLSNGSISAVHVKNPFYIYRVGREGSISTNKKIKNFKDQQIIRKTVHHLLLERDDIGSCFYRSLFQDSVNCLMEASAFKLLKFYRSFWDREDKRIMKKGVRSQYDYKIWLLASIHPTLMVKYINDSFPAFLRRIYNIVTEIISPIRSS